jgi:hypothetical protein
MPRTILSRIGLAMILAGILAGCGFPTGPDAVGPPHVGEVTFLHDPHGGEKAVAEAWIEEDPSVSMEDWVEDPTPSTRKGSYRVDSTTRVYRESPGGGLQRVRWSELSVGSVVRVWTTGVELRGLIPGYTAAEIHILSGPR